MKIYLPWKRKGYDGKKYQATLEITYDHTQKEEIFKFAEVLRRRRSEAWEQRAVNKQIKEEKGGVRYCKGHKKKFEFKDDRCTLCGGRQNVVNG